MIDRLDSFPFDCLLLLHHLYAFQVNCRYFAQAGLIQPDEIGLLLFDDLFDERRCKDMRSVWPLDRVQVVSDQLFIISVRFREVIQARCDLKLLRIVFLVQLLQRFKRVSTSIGRAFNNTGAV